MMRDLRQVGCRGCLMKPDSVTVNPGLNTHKDTQLFICSLFYFGWRGPGARGLKITKTRTVLPYLRLTGTPKKLGGKRSRASWRRHGGRSENALAGRTGALKDLEDLDA